MIFLCRLIDSPYNISQSLAFVKHFFQLFQFIVFNNFELFLLLLQFSLLFLNCFCCVCLVFGDVDYNTTLPRVCQLLFYVFLHFFTLQKPFGVMFSPSGYTANIILSLNCNSTVVTIPITPPSFLPILLGNPLNFSLTDSVYQDHMDILPCTYCSQYSHQSYSCVPVLLHQAMLLMVLGES